MDEPQIRDIAARIIQDNARVWHARRHLKALKRDAIDASRWAAWEHEQFLHLLDVELVQLDDTEWRERHDIEILESADFEYCVMHFHVTWLVFCEAIHRMSLWQVTQGERYRMVEVMERERVAATEAQSRREVAQEEWVSHQRIPARMVADLEWLMMQEGFSDERGALLSDEVDAREVLEGHQSIDRIELWMEHLHRVGAAAIRGQCDSDLRDLMTWRAVGWEHAVRCHEHRTWVGHAEDTDRHLLLVREATERLALEERLWRGAVQGSEREGWSTALQAMGRSEKYMVELMRREAEYREGCNLIAEWEVVGRSRIEREEAVPRRDMLTSHHIKVRVLVEEEERRRRSAVEEQDYSVRQVWVRVATELWEEDRKARERHRIIAQAGQWAAQRGSLEVTEEGVRRTLEAEEWRQWAALSTRFALRSAVLSVASTADTYLSPALTEAIAPAVLALPPLSTSLLPPTTYPTTVTPTTPGVFGLLPPITDPPVLSSAVTTVAPVVVGKRPLSPLLPLPVSSPLTHSKAPPTSTYGGSAAAAHSRLSALLTTLPAREDYLRDAILMEEATERKGYVLSRGDATHTLALGTLGREERPKRGAIMAGEEEERRAIAYQAWVAAERLLLISERRGRQMVGRQQAEGRLALKQVFASQSPHEAQAAYHVLLIQTFFRGAIGIRVGLERFEVAAAEERRLWKERILSEAEWNEQSRDFFGACERDTTALLQSERTHWAHLCRAFVEGSARVHAEERANVVSGERRARLSVATEEAATRSALEALEEDTAAELEDTTTAAEVMGVLIRHEAADRAFVATCEADEWTAIIDEEYMVRKAIERRQWDEDTTAMGQRAAQRILATEMEARARLVVSEETMREVYSHRVHHGRNYRRLETKQRWEVEEEEASLRKGVEQAEREGYIDLTKLEGDHLAVTVRHDEEEGRAIVVKEEADNRRDLEIQERVDADVIDGNRRHQRDAAARILQAAERGRRGRAEARVLRDHRRRVHRAHLHEVMREEAEGEEAVSMSIEDDRSGRVFWEQTAWERDIQHEETVGRRVVVEGEAESRRWIRRRELAERIEKVGDPSDLPVGSSTADAIALSPSQRVLAADSGSSPPSPLLFPRQTTPPGALQARERSRIQKQCTDLLQVLHEKASTDREWAKQRHQLEDKLGRLPAALPDTSQGVSAPPLSLVESPKAGDAADDAPYIGKVARAAQEFRRWQQGGRLPRLAPAVPQSATEVPPPPLCTLPPLPNTLASGGGSP